MNRTILSLVGACLLASLGCTDSRFAKRKDTETVQRAANERPPESRSASLTRWNDVEPTPEAADGQIRKLREELLRDMDSMPKSEKTATADATKRAK